MNGGNNSHNSMSTFGYMTKTGTNSTTGTNSHLGIGRKLVLRTEERVLKFEIYKLRAELVRLQAVLGPNSPKVIAIQNQLLRDGAKLFRIENKLGQIVVL